MKTIKLFFLIVLLIFTCYSFQSSSETVNPFNQFMSPSGGVNLFSGDAVFSQPITSIAGRGGMNAAVTLSYSSNVYLNVRAKNDNAPTGWLGLGWNLNYGSVLCDHKGTKSLADDDYYWISPLGFRDKILKKNGFYYAKSDPYTKITQVVSTTDANIIKGWIFTGIDGKKIKYGNLDNAAGTATRYSFYWGDFVGTGTSGTPLPYPYMWDVASMEDVAGNTVRFEYNQTKEYVKFRNGGLSPIPYTKASYVKKIYTPDSAFIEFKLIAKSSNEYFDPYTYQAEPDAFMEMYEDSLLDSIKVYNASNSVLKIFKLTYEKINQSISGTFLKSLLLSISEMDASGRQMSKTQFTYNDDITKDGNVSFPNYNYGALASITSSSGGIIHYAYEKKQIAANKQKDTIIAGLHSTSYLGETSDGNPYSILVAGNTVYAYNWNGSSWEQKLKTTAGNMDRKTVRPGFDYFMVLDSSSINNLRVYAWDGRNWVIAKRKTGAVIDDFYLIDLGSSEAKSVYLSKDYFIVKAAPDYHTIWLFKKDGTTFESESLPDGVGGMTTGGSAFGDGNQKELQLGLTHCIIEGFEKIWILNKDETGWKIDNDFNGKILVDGQANSVILNGDDYFVVKNAVAHYSRIWLFQWNGTQWVSVALPITTANPDITTTGGTDFGADEVEKAGVYCSPRHCILTTVGGESIWILNRDGDGWKMDAFFKPGQISAGYDNSIYAGEDFFWAKSAANNYQTVVLYRWNGSSWEKQPLPDATLTGMTTDLTSLNGGKKGNFLIRGNHCSFVEETGPKVWVFNRDGQDWILDAAIRATNLGNDNIKSFEAGPNYILSKPEPYNAIYLYVWDGLKWDTIYTNGFNDAYEKHITGSPYADYFLMQGGSTDGEVHFFNKFQDEYRNPIYTYSVTIKTADPIVPGSSPIVTSYNYNESIGNYGNGTTKYNKVDVTQPGIGKTSSYFFNYTSANGQNDPTQGGNSIYDKLDGNVYKTVIKNAKNKTVDSSSISYIVFRNDINWPDDIYQRRTTKTTSTISGVTSVNDVLAYNDTNGLPYISRTANSDGRQKLSKTFFAFENAAYSSAMGTSGANMLNVPCQTIVYEKEAGDNTDPNETEIRSAQVMTYSNNLGCDAWMPYRSYIWNVPMDGNGIPDPLRPYKNYFAFPTDPNWKFATGITRYSSYGNTLELLNPLSIYSATVYGTRGNQPIGSIAPANYYESGVFTCDYDLSEILDAVTYLDKMGGWEKGYNWGNGGNAISNNQTHFGQKALYLNNGEAGIIRVAKVNGGVGYTFSAWARVNSGTLNLKAEYYTGNSTVASWPVDRSTLTTINSEAGIASLGNTSGAWQLLKTSFTVPPAVTNYYVVAYIGSAGAYEAYVDDIRFGPSKAQISTTYYDTLWQQPILSVGPDNNPGSLIEYDNFGRQSLTYKIDKNTNDLTVTSIKSYHLMNEPPLFDATKWFKIVTKVDATRGVDIKDGNISIYEHQPLQLWQNGANDYQLWKFIAAGDGNYFIQTKANTAFYIDDPFKTLVNGSQLQIWDGAGPNQKWNVAPMRDGCYRITPFASGGKAMEYNAPAGQAPANGLAVQLSSYKNKDNQKWRIVEVQ